MSKKFDLRFDDVDLFLQQNPKFAVTKPVPNYAAIRAVLRSGVTLEGVTLIEAKPDEEYPGIKNTTAPGGHPEAEHSGHPSAKIKVS